MEYSVYDSCQSDREFGMSHEEFEGTKAKCEKDLHLFLFLNILYLI